MSIKLNVTPEQARELVAKGHLPASALDRVKGKRKEKPLVKAAILLETPNRISFCLPVKTVSESNKSGKGAWRGKSNRTKCARDIVSKFMAAHARKFLPFNEHFQAGGVLHLTFTRVGCIKLDGMANLGHALKATEDAVAMMLGANDGSNRWIARAEQDTGNAFVGISVDIRKG